MKIKFVDGEENGAIIEAPEQRKQSLFSNQYVLAHALWQRLVGSNDLRKKNNLIAFCGDRGTGKTSCMESFLEQVKKDYADEVVALSPIDPSFFDDSHNILELVLGQIYRVICNDEKQRRKEGQGDAGYGYATQHLLENFNRVFADLKYLAKASDKEHFYDSMEELDSLAVGLNLSEEIAALIQEFLKYKQKPEGILVIPIDDLDLNITGAYVMSEFLRKYLVNEHCVILLSVRVEQLIEAVSSHIKKENHSMADTEIRAKAVKYVSKLLPAGSRIAMPVFENYYSYELSIQNGEAMVEYNSIQEAVVRLVFSKTGYLFYNSKGGSSLLIPRNLRSLRHLIHLLSSMTDHDKANSAQLHENQRIFKDYFFHTWTMQLNEDFRKRIDAILEVNNDVTFNKVVVMQLAGFAGKQEDNAFLKEILDESNYTYNVSLGDVFRVIDFLRQKVSDLQLQLFLFFISSLYSMKLYESYDTITENLNAAPQEPDEKEGKAEIYASDALFDQTNALQRLVNGQFFSYERDELLPGRKEGNSRDLTLLNGTAFGTDLSTLYEKFRKNEEFSEDEKKKFRLLEFFILTTSRYVSIKQKDADYGKKRKYSMPSHLETIERQAKNVVFDVLAPFYNVLNLRDAYDRFIAFGDGKVSLYEKAKAQDWTLLNRLMNYDYARNYEIKDHSLLSDAVLRNTEVMDAMFERMRKDRTAKYDADNRACLKQFYEQIIKTDMVTYPVTHDGEPYAIKFQFLEPLKNILDEASENDFNNIYMYSLVENQWMNAFTSKTNIGRVVIRNIREKLPDLYQKKTQEEWEAEFKSDTAYNRGHSIDRIQSLLAEYELL